MPARPPVHGAPAGPAPRRHTTSRPKKPDPFYYSAAWRSFRAAILGRDGYRCTWVRGSLGRCRSRATTVDHILAIKDGGAKLDPSNARSLCRACDNLRHAEKGGDHGGR